MNLDVSQQREVRQIAGGAGLLEFYSKRVDEQLASKALEHPGAQSAQRSWFDGSASAPLEDTAFVQHILYDLNLGAQGAFVRENLLSGGSLDGADAEALGTALANTHLSLLEVVESKRGRGVQLLDRLTQQSHFIDSADLAEALEPMEVVLGRVGSWDEKNILLPSWEKVWFRGRKAVIQDLLTSMEADGLTEDDEADVREVWLRRETPRVVRRTREATPQ